MALVSLREQVNQAIQEAAGNVQVKNLAFQFQSFFDNTQLGQAILVQPSSSPIVPSTLTTVRSPGFGLGLHPDSQSPVAVQFKGGAGISDSQTTILTPGQIVYPHGCAPFSGFDVGLPFGWLGGGNVQLVIMKTQEAAVWWAPSAEVVIQRQRVQIQADGASPTFSYGLPLGFPWKNAVRYGTPQTFPQAGSAVITAIPTRTEFKLRISVAANLAADALVQMLVKNSQAFDQDDNGTAGHLSGDIEMAPILFPKLNGSAAYFSTAGFSFPVPGNQLASAGQGSHSPGVLLAGDDAQFCLMNESGNANVTNAFCDITRFGLI